jgi:hypothetical protein
MSDETVAETRVYDSEVDLTDSSYNGLDFEPLPLLSSYSSITRDNSLGMATIPSLQIGDGERLETDSFVSRGDAKGVVTDSDRAFSAAENLNRQEMTLKDGSTLAVEVHSDGRSAISVSKPDGSEFVQVFRPDGSREGSIKTFHDGTKEVRIYHDNYKIAGITVYLPSGDLALSQQFRRDGSRAAETSYHRDGTETWTTYGNKGERLGSQRFDSKTRKPVSPARP